MRSRSGGHADFLLRCYRVVAMPAKSHFFTCDGIFCSVGSVGESAEFVRCEESDVLDCLHQEIPDAVFFQPVGRENAVSPVREYPECQRPVAGLSDVVDFAVEESVNLRSRFVQCSADACVSWARSMLLSASAFSSSDMMNSNSLCIFFSSYSQVVYKHSRHSAAHRN